MESSPGRMGRFEQMEREERAYGAEGTARSRPRTGHNVRYRDYPQKSTRR